ncbi:outer membrane beta-barrel family protein [Flavivirga algicola]|uniref:TonB-dependent receptor n=1 Tax=Flavivirga algicola TaxID=2729136 RepID=A0ABX1S173_9FLAO|nr:outer membrane beta-barrel family protein [Flavivirga algicola]NMH89582.1 TonB-dependent receptor [Flavivirga algicola]
MRSFSICYLFLCCLKIHAQIKGKVVDINQKPIAFANVMLYADNNKTLINGVITNENGNFNINNLNTAVYTLRVSLLTYETWESTPFEYTIDTIKNMPEIVLKELIDELDAITLVSKKKLIKNTQEGSIVNVQESILTKGSTALQLLERSPGVILDQRNNSFSLNGKSNTTVMINGKVIRIPTAEVITMLNGMSADNIEQIELLTNPSSKYDADGNAGIINIVMKKNENLGFHGNTSISTGYGIGVKQTNSLSLNYGTEKLAAFGTYSFAYDDTFDGFRGIGSTTLPVIGGTTLIDFNSETARINRSHNINLGLDYQLNKNSVVGASILLNSSNPTINTKNRGLYNFEVNPYLDARINLISRSSWKNYNVSTFYEFSNKVQSFTMTSDYIKYNNQSPNYVSSSYFNELGEPFQPEDDIYNTGNRGFNVTNINVGVIKADYKNNVNEKLVFEAGLKGSISKTENEARIEIEENDVFVSDDRFISNIETKEQIAALYAQGNYKLSNQFSLQIGARYEYWNQSFDASNLNRRFGKLFPSAFFTKTISDTTSWSVAYTKRITRPNYIDLASYLRYNSPTSVFTGNPQLLPAITNSLNFTYNYKSLSFSLVGTLEDNPIAYYQVTEDDRSDLAIISPQNLEYQNSLDMQFNIPWRLSSWWNINWNSTLGYRVYKLLHTPQETTNNYLHFNFNINQTFNITNNLSLELSGWYTSNHFNGSYKVDGFGSLNTGLRKDFKNGGSIQFTITDLLKSIHIKSSIGSLTQEAYNNIFDVSYKPESARSSIFRLSYTYNFGNSKAKKGSSRTGAQDENSRI